MWGVLERLRQKMSDLVGMAEKFMDKDVFEACMAAVVMVGWCDGDFDASEKTKCLAFVQAHPAMKRFNANDIKKAFDKFDGTFTLDKGMGKDECMKAMRPMMNKDEDARRLVIRLMILIGGADDNFDKQEQALVREMCGKLGLRASEFEL